MWLLKVLNNFSPFCWLFKNVDNAETIRSIVPIFYLLMNVEKVVEYVLAGE
jgi:hypothetical protein